MLENNKTEIRIGIDFGIVNSCSGVYINEEIKIVPNKIGETITPTNLFIKATKIIDQSNKEITKEEIFAGEEALYEPIDNLGNYIYEIKKFVGLNYEELKKGDFNDCYSYILENKDGILKIKIKLNDEYKYYTIEGICALIIKKILQSIEDFIIKSLDIKFFEITHIVFTIPKRFTESQEKSFFLAAKMAGIETPGIIYEPFAAILAYEKGKDLLYKHKNLSIPTKSEEDHNIGLSSNQLVKSEEKVMVFNLGEEILDLTIVNINKNKDNSSNYDIIINKGNLNLGGKDFDKLLMEHCIKYFCENVNLNKFDILKDYNACRKLKMKCRNAKNLLSSKNHVIIKIDNFYKKNDLILNIRRNEFRQICEPLYERIKKTIDIVLIKVKFKPNDIDKVILVGGSTRINGIKNILFKIFGENKIKDYINPEEVLAIGATSFAGGFHIPTKQNIILKDFIPFNLGIAAMNPDPNDSNKEIMHTIIEKFSQIPCRKIKRYKTKLSEKNPNIVVTVYKGNYRNIKYNLKLGQSIISGLNKKGDVIYKVILNVDVNGKLTGFIESDELNIKKEINITEKYITRYPFNNKIYFAKNPILEKISNIISDIQNQTRKIKKSQNISEKLNNLIECSKLYEELLKNFNVLMNTSENLYEKIFLYTKELFKLYLERLKIKKEDMKQLIQNIKEGMMNLMKEQNYIEDLMLVFRELRSAYKNEFYLIFSNYIEIFINEGITKIMQGKLCRYYEKLIFEKVFVEMRKYVDENDLYLIDPEIKKFYDSQKLKVEEKLRKRKCFVFLLDNFINEGKYLLRFNIYSMTNKIDGIKQENYLKDEEVREILDFLLDMADLYKKNEKPIKEAYCLANIINIYFNMLKIKVYEDLEIFIERINFIMDRKIADEYEWYKDIINIIESISKNIYIN